ncbi:MAG: hypothetical protein HY905_10555 [Deltaproteobacteria bacterium]|nr:hypothetical protein [Deltaproteobacteria bacterium]
MRRTLAGVSMAFVALGCGCESDVPESGDDGGGDDSSAEADAEAEAAVEDSAADADADDDADVPPPCDPLATDYLPRESGSATDDWPACISDDNTYHWIGTTIGTIARIASFEQVADLLWRRPAPPAATDFTAARVIYADANGLDSRVQRREDLHVPEVPAADGACTDPGVPELYPDRCVGPARILPILNDAFAAGSAGADLLLNAARIEAALLWFLYLSPYKESYTCTSTPADCDSAWAYYTGGEDRAAGLGLSSYVSALDVETHDRVWDGLLAVRCWKNLDNETGASTDTTMRDLARAQLDRAMLRGVALVVRDRLDVVVSAATTEERDAAWAFVQILGWVLDREATARNATTAAVLRTELARTDPTAAGVPAAQAALDALFPCP